MPGGRLTVQDRRQIAAGMADGLSLAEIARQLSRPTSTIAREVNRNLGPGGYQADRAEQAARRRAHRRNTPGPSPAPGPGADTASGEAGAFGRDPAAVSAFEERYAQALVGMGMPQMSARVLTCLAVVDNGGLTSAELVQRLRVSPATISKVIAFLEEQQLIRRERDGRRERYIGDDDVWYRATMLSADTNNVFAATSLDGAEVLGVDTPAGARLHEMGRFLRHFGEDMRRSAEYWHATLRGEPTTAERPPSVLHDP